MADFNLVQPSPVPLTFQTTGDLSNQFKGLSQKVGNIAQGSAISSVPTDQPPADYLDKMGSALAQLNPELAQKYKQQANQMRAMSDIAKRAATQSNGNAGQYQETMGEGLSSIDPASGLPYLQAAQTTQANQAGIQNTQAHTMSANIANVTNSFAQKKDLLSQQHDKAIAAADALPKDAKSQNLATQIKQQAAQNFMNGISQAGKDYGITVEGTQGQDVVTPEEELPETTNDDINKVIYNPSIVLDDGVYNPTKANKFIGGLSAMDTPAAKGTLAAINQFKANQDAKQDEVAKGVMSYAPQAEAVKNLIDYSKGANTNVFGLITALGTQNDGTVNHQQGMDILKSLLTLDNVGQGIWNKIINSLPGGNIPVLTPNEQARLSALASQMADVRKQSLLSTLSTYSATIAKKLTT